MRVSKSAIRFHALDNSCLRVLVSSSAWAAAVVTDTVLWGSFLFSWGLCVAVPFIVMQNTVVKKIKILINYYGGINKVSMTNSCLYPRKGPSMAWWGFHFFQVASQHSQERILYIKQRRQMKKNEIIYRHYEAKLEESEKLTVTLNQEIWLETPVLCYQVTTIRREHKLIFFFIINAKKHHIYTESQTIWLYPCEQSTSS